MHYSSQGPSSSGWSLHCCVSLVVASKWRSLGIELAREKESGCIKNLVQGRHVKYWEHGFIQIMNSWLLLPPIVQPIWMRHACNKDDQPIIIVYHHLFIHRIYEFWMTIKLKQAFKGLSFFTHDYFHCLAVHLLNVVVLCGKLKCSILIYS